MSASPSQVLTKILTDAGLGTVPVPRPAAGTWPVYYGGQASSPDESIAVLDTEGKNDDRNMVDGAPDYHYGIQIQVRGLDHVTGYAKAEAIRQYLCKGLYAHTVVIAGTGYYVHCAIPGQVLPLGKETPDSKRSLFTLNLTIPVQSPPP